MLDDATLSISRVLRTLHKERRADRIAHLRSIDHDANFVAGAHATLGRPALLANLRCGVWYVDQALSAGNCYFKSTDGHAGGWAFSLSRINMQVDRQLLAHPPPHCHLASSPPPRLVAPSTTVPAASDRSRPRHLSPQRHPSPPSPFATAALHLAGRSCRLCARQRDGRRLDAEREAIPRQPEQDGADLVLRREPRLRRAVCRPSRGLGHGPAPAAVGERHTRTCETPLGHLQDTSLRLL